jgi:phospholipid-transporting ATPase
MATTPTSEHIEKVINDIKLSTIEDETRSTLMSDGNVNIMSVQAHEGTESKKESEKTRITENQQSHEIYVSNREANKAQRMPLLNPNYSFRGWHPFKYLTFITKRKYPDNAVKTTIYTWWNFIILNLLYQYTTKLSNIYFTIVMIFSLLPNVSPVFPITSIIPVCFIVGVNMLKDLFEDLRRWQADRRINTKKLRIITKEGVEKEVQTSDVYAGDIVKIEEGEAFPADLVLISTSNSGQCYIETANLDGESNFKPRWSLTETSGFDTPEKLAKMNRCKVTCGPPDDELYKFVGTLHIPADLAGDLVHAAATQNDQSTSPDEPKMPLLQETPKPHIQVPEDGFKFPLTKDNLLLKGSSLRNTEWVYGITIYTGHDTKLMKNMKPRKTKNGYVEMRLNLLLGGLLLLHQTLTIIFVAISSVYQNSIVLNSWYIFPISSSKVTFLYVLYAYFTNFILLNLLIPMSLFVSLQFIKAIQGGFMEQDKQMTWGGKRMQAMATDLNADLSQVEIIFSDKTGTLTNNEMFFKKAAIGLSWVHDEYKEPGALSTRIKNLQHQQTLPQSGHVQGEDDDAAKAMYSMHFLLNIALCHQAKPKAKGKQGLDDEEIDEELVSELSPNAEDQAGPIEYQAESPDEVALVSAARDNDFVVLEQTDRYIELSVFGVTHKFFVEATIEFSPDRKRMSQVLRIPASFAHQFPWFLPENTCICYAKGADSYMFARMNTGFTPDEQVIMAAKKKRMNHYVDEFATEGLRTLILCYKILDEKTASAWLKAWRQAKLATQDKEQKETEVAAILERDLELIGSTAIEDKLQEFVPETITFIMKAGLKMWMLTGDKRQTAKNIAKTTGLFQDHTKVLDLDTTTDEPTEKVTRENCAQKMDDIYSKVVQFIEEDPTAEIALVVDGDGLNFAMEKRNLPIFVKIVEKCKTAICCRATPLNKASLVELMRKKFKMVGLAIGDGANDVTMIQKAKVGIGIAGKEGSQAKQASDYCLQRFHHLKRLLFIHGRYSLTRSALFVQYSFYKNLLLTFTQVFFSFYCLFSGQTLVDSWVQTLYNLIFTLLPPFVMGLFEKDVDEKVLMEKPEFYKQLQKEHVLNGWTFSLWILQAFYHSTIIFFFSIYISYYSGFLSNMHSGGIWITATIISSVSFLCVNIKAILEMSYFTWIHWVCIGLSVFVYYAFNFCYSGIPVLDGSSNMYFTTYVAFGSGNFWLIHVLCLSACYIPDLTFKLIKKYFFPYPWEVERIEYMKRQRALKRIKNQAVNESNELQGKSTDNAMELKIINEPV